MPESEHWQTHYIVGKLGWLLRSGGWRTTVGRANTATEPGCLVTHIHIHTQAQLDYSESADSLLGWEVILCNIC